MIKAIIFDCFGVLLTDGLQLLYDELFATDPEAAKEIKALVRASNRGILDPQESNRQIAELLHMKPEAYRQAILQSEVKDQRLLAFIKDLKTRYKIGVLSNISLGGFHRRFSSEEIAAHFDEVVTSAEIGVIKPDAEAYRIAADRLRVRPEECLFTDDRADFCVAAEAIGMQAIVYTGFDQFQRDLNKLLG